MLRKIILRFTPVSHEELVLSGFGTNMMYYRLMDLNIYVINRKFYYYTPDGKRHRIRNMLRISNLIYGNTEYLHV